MTIGTAARRAGRIDIWQNEAPPLERSKAEPTDGVIETRDDEVSGAALVKPSAQIDAP
jgi:hypothetical protein